MKNGPPEKGSFTAREWQLVQKLNTLAEGVAALYDGASTPIVEPGLWIRSSATSETVTITKRMIIRACGWASRRRR